MRIIVCPGCGVKIKVPAERSGRCACPKCGKAMMIKAPSPVETVVASDVDLTPVTSPLPAQPASSEFPAFTTGQGKQLPSISHGGQRGSDASVAAELKPFLKRLGIGLGILSGVLVLLTGLGMIAEPIALGATIVAVLSAVVLIIGGKIWLWVIAFQESVTQGLLVLLVPYYWIVYLATRKGRCLRALAIVLSAAVPALLTMAMLAVFAGRYDSVARSWNPGSARTSRMPQSKVRALEDRIRRAYETSGETDVLQTVSFGTFSQVRGPVVPAKCEQALVDQPGYVAGSFRFDAQQRTVMFQYHGGKEMARMYALLLPAKADIMIAFTPTFVEPSDLPATNTTQARPSVATSPTISPAPVTILESVESEANALRTVSFQTLAQNQFDTARADSVLAEMPDYVAGSFRFDQEQQEITFQYRGQKAAATQYAFALQGKMLIMLRLKPVFAE